MCMLMSHRAQECTTVAGEAAVRYFEQTNPEYPRFGAGSTSDNTAEWIVDLTTKVAPSGLMPTLLFWAGHQTT